MIYFDTAFIVKCYVPEPGFGPVRELLHRSQGAACCSFGRLEFTAALRRAVREGRLPSSAVSTILSVLTRDDENGVWMWLPLTPGLLENAARAVRSLPAEIAIRAADALHLVCARDNGYRQICTNDRHIVAAAPYFNMQAVNVIP